MTQSWFYIVTFNGTTLMNNGFALAWSISTEFFFYLCYLGLVFVLAGLRSRRSTMAAAAIFSVAALAISAGAIMRVNAVEAFASGHLRGFISMQGNWENSFVRWLLYISPYFRIGEFILGCLTAELYSQFARREVTPAEERVGEIALAAALVVLGYLVASQIVDVGPPEIYGFLRMLNLNFGYAVPIAVVIFCVSRYRSRLGRLLAWAPLVALGEISYSIYCVHTWTLRPLIRGSVPFSHAHELDGAARIVLGITVTLIFSTATYRLIEVPGREWTRGFLRRLMVKAFGPQAANCAVPDLRLRRAGIALISLVVFFGLCIMAQLKFA